MRVLELDSYFMIGSDIFSIYNEKNTDIIEISATFNILKITRNFMKKEYNRIYIFNYSF
jgi:hypothetical protein